MKFIIKHEIKGRLRIHVIQKDMSFAQADSLQYYITTLPGVISAKVYERTADAAIVYEGERTELLEALQKFRYEEVEVPDIFLQNSGRELNAEYWEKLVNRVVLRAGEKLFLPMSIRSVITTVKAVPYVWAGLKSLWHKKIEVPVLDGTAVAVSVLRQDYNTASSIMFLLGIGEILEEWTHKKSVEDLARSLSLQVEKAWLVRDGQEILVPVGEIAQGDEVVVHMGNVIPFDGEVTKGDAMVNQASLTGESVPVHKTIEGYVYAGTVLEEGELTIRVKMDTGSSKFEQIVSMIEESEKLKSALESKAEHLADRLVPYTLGGSALTWLLTQNVTKAVAVLMVDYSCALKLAMPISVLSAIREASNHQVTVKGGKFLESLAQADTIVFDKTGTLTKAHPTVVDVISFGERQPDELLRIAACLEEHFPHSMAKAVVEAAQAKGLEHEEMHSQVEYVVAHGIVSSINDKRVIIGSHHFVFEDEKCVVRNSMKERYKALPKEYSRLYLAIDNVLEAVLCIEDPVREDAREVVEALRSLGISNIVMMTGDSEHAARRIAAEVGVDSYRSGVLPEDKARFIEQQKADGKTVVMIGDGINDSPALSAADVGIAISDGAQIAREIADIMVGADDLYQIVTLKAISNALMKRIQKNYRLIVGFNTGLILLGVAGVLAPTTSALLHNSSTLLISLKSMENLLTDI
ncbi:MAG: heavy metal translocating P-type ATPase [Lachnospiraceae bacterium]|nr:heavy metal translocating P-type ATPase [Lachnospiraceae bacterium]